MLATTQNATIRRTVLLAALMAPGAALAQPDYDQLAHRVINTTAQVKPGDVVVISGGKHNLALMESLTNEANKAGGMTTMMISTDKVDRFAATEVPEKYLEQEPRFLGEWLKQVDVFISLPSDEDPKAVAAGVPEARWAKIAKANEAVNDLIMSSRRLRFVTVGYPSKDEAADYHVDFAAYSKMHWDAVSADYNQISAKGKSIQKALAGAKTVRVTSPAGTDVTFTIGDRPVILNDGIMTPEKLQSALFMNRSVSLPGGDIFVAPLETSANGKVSIPKGVCRYEPMTGISFEFHAGKLEGFKAAQNGNCFAESMAPYSGPKDIFASFVLGLNPAMKAMDQGGLFFPGTAAGLVYISIGDNHTVGGANQALTGFSFPIMNATVTADGKTVVKDGRIVM